jgi:phenylacetate-coenzyme A ligase PaaK-like adenylate-forming protein
MKTDTRAALLQRVEDLPTADYTQLAVEVFRYQYQYNAIYRQFVDLLGVNTDGVNTLSAIPHLPISLFKGHVIQSGIWPAVRTFTSSGTTGAQTSRHLLRDEAAYRRNARRGFTAAYGPVRDYCFLALLPAYLERTGSSLVFMADDFIRQSRYPESGFFLNDLAALVDRLAELRSRQVPTVLLGVSFALLDLAEQYGPLDLESTIVMETGGMKGRRRELTRTELHTLLTRGLGVTQIHSEYGMTELLSQAYSPGEGLFKPSPTLRVRARDITDPLAPAPLGKTGVLQLTDLANLDTISFIASEDLGRVYADGSFEVLGRLDHADVRGCNLLLSDAT